LKEKKRMKKPTEEEEAEFLEQKYSYAVVIKGTPEKIQHLKELIVEEGLNVIYQRISLAPLWIQEEKQ
jgi:hypothetical protein